MLQLNILTPIGEIFNDSVTSVTIPTQNGEISILGNHADLVSQLNSGPIIIKKVGKETAIVITGGFLEIKSDTATILSDYAIMAHSIKIAEIKEAKRRAEEMLTKKESDEHLLVAQKELEKTTAALRVAQRLNIK